jgi:putative protease
LIEVGVCSFKIEGRLKDPAYVQNVVAHYRTRLDTIMPDLNLQASSSGRVSLDFEPNLSKTFNRNYTSYNLTGRRDQITAWETPKHAGEPIGVVTDIGANFFRLNVAPHLNNGDGLTFIDQDGQLQGTLVNRVDGQKVFPAKMAGILAGIQIRRNVDRAFLKQLDQSKPDRRIPLKIGFGECDDGFLLSGEDQDGNQAVVLLQWEKTLARDAKKADITLERQLTRLGDSVFTCEKFEMDLNEVHFLPASRLNALRRALVDELMAERKRKYPRWKAKNSPNVVPYPSINLTFWGNVLNRKAEAFYRRHGVQTIELAAESGLDMLGRKVMTTKHCIKYELGGCPHQDDAVQFNEPLYLVDDRGLRLRLAFNCRDCLMDVYFERVGR